MAVHQMFIKDIIGVKARVLEDMDQVQHALVRLKSSNNTLKNELLFIMDVPGIYSINPAQKSLTICLHRVIL